MTRHPWRPPALAGSPDPGLALALTDGDVLLADDIDWKPSYRIITSEYADENLLAPLLGAASPYGREDDLEALQQIADLTNPSVQHAAGQLDLVRPEDRLYGPGTALIMTAFAYPAAASRFSDGQSGVYYAARELDTAIAETVHHTEQVLIDSGPVIVEKTLIHADLVATVVDIRAGCPCPHGVYDPVDYTASQAFGAALRRLDSFGVGYDSVRMAAGMCAAVFRPPALARAQAVRTLLYQWDGARVVVR